MLHRWEIWLVIIQVVAFHFRAGASIYVPCLNPTQPTTIYDEFKVNWCRQQKWRLDWQSMKKACPNLHYRKHDEKQYQT